MSDYDLSRARPAIPVTVRLQGALARALDAEGNTVSAEIESQVGAVVASLGVPATVEPLVSSGSWGGEITDPGVRMKVGEHVCRYADSTLARVSASLRARIADSGRLTNAALDDWTPSELAELVGKLCAEAVKRQPAVLPYAGWLPHYAQSLGPAGSVGHGIRDYDWLGRVLTGVLELGISVANTEIVSSLLTQGDDGDVVTAQETLIMALARETIDLVVPEDIADQLCNVDQTDSGNLLNYVATGMFEELGVVFPPVVSAEPLGLPANTFSIRVNDVIGMSHALPDYDECLVNGPPAQIASIVPDARPALIPATDRVGSLVPRDLQRTLEAEAWTTWDRVGYATLQVAATMRNYSAAFLHQDRVLAQLDALEEGWADLVRAARSQLSPPMLTALLRRLVRGGVPLRHLPSVLERVVDLPANELGVRRHATLDDPVSFRGARKFNGTALDEFELFMRTGMREQIGQRICLSAGLVVAYLMSEEAEHMLCAGPMDEEVADRVVAAVRRELAYLPVGSNVPVLLTDPVVRPILHGVLRHPFPLLMVISHTDLPANVSVQPISRIELDE